MGGDENAVDPVDQWARAAIVAERARNVWVVAGAGTGKTRTIIDRAIDLLAPAGDAAPVPITRLAAITFTRRAAGELRFRLRERLLGELQRVAAAGGARVARLSDALSNLDAAFIGTIHGFADRLLRLRPVEAQLSPAYLLVEDNEALVHETFLRLRRGAESGTLAAELGGRAAAIAPELIAEAAETLRAATRAGLQMERRENAFGSMASVEAMLASMVETRDVRVPLPPIPDPGIEVAQAAARRASDMFRSARGNAAGHRRLRRIVRALQRLAFTHDPAEAFRIVAETRRGRDLYQREFDGDSVGYTIYTALRDAKPGSLAEQLQGPHRWLAARLVRLFPVVAAMYERVKDDHEVVDYLDLLIKLRNLLRDDCDARAFYQQRFDHLFVDEFQDTDPLQCEIVFYLCEQGTTAQDWAQVDLTPGKLTIVGDPKQSIYRFRRADIAMYGRAGSRVAASGALQQRLETNFRSRPELIDFFNAQLAGVLGERAGEPFDPTAGRAHYEPLHAAAAIAPGGVCVHLLPYAGAGGERLLAGNGRAVEGAAVARYIRWLLASGHPVRDPETDVERPVRPGDIAVLAPVTTQLRQLLQPLDELGIEYTARGGVLFLAHPTVRRYLLALRALADRDDGVAAAALLQPPFFAVSWPDVVAARRADPAAVTDAQVRVAEARAIIAALRAARHSRAPGATARDLIERTALGRFAATARNGRQLLAALYEVAAELDRRAALEGLDFDAATEIVRSWAVAPVYLDAPEPLGAGAVRVQTIHQAKGLEFPVVIVWDGFQTLSDHGNATWQVDRDGHAWSLRLGQIMVEHPPDSGVLRRERELGEHERRRLYYVAATRARDLLVLPLPATRSERLQYATRELAAKVRDDLVVRLAPFVPGAEPEWAAAAPAGGSMAIAGDATLQVRVASAAARLAEAVAAQSPPRALPVAVTAAAAAGDELDARAVKVAGARYGKAFGLVVHRALELHLSGACAGLDDAVTRAMAEVGDRTHQHEARADVERALAALDSEAIAAAAGWQLRVEFPLCAARPGVLVSGLIDLVGVRDDAVVVIDFKTDQPRPGQLREAYPAYAAQLDGYVELLGASGWLAGRPVRAALLFTAAGELRWLAAADDHRGGG